MIVFGDPQFTETLSASVATLRERVRLADLNSLDDWRALLIQCGQIEQAVGDCDVFQNSEIENHFQEITDVAAGGFCAAWRENSRDVGGDSLDWLQRKLECLNAFPDVPLTLKIPEGYEFYSLYPEQYCVSAERWANEHSDANRVLVAGVRSIGTSLAAVVAARLNVAGFQTDRITVRPGGNPFQRTVALPKNLPPELRHALIVDEGPGISGSSMVAVADALLAAGVPRENIFFFPGHENPPGPQASDSIRRWWNLASRYFTPLSEVRWHAKSLRELLLEKSAELLPDAGIFETIDDLSNGLWRNFVYKNERGWPAVCLPFERTKFLCRTRDGVGVLWKFNGLGSAFGSQRNGRKFPHLGGFRGFGATRWIEGAPLNRNDTTLALKKILAVHLDNVAGSPMSFDEIESGIERLSSMARHNLSRAVPDFDDCEIEFLASGGREFFRQNPSDKTARSYGDGRMAPHEWIRDSKKTFKTDIGGHDADHTMVGRQSVLWDIAGALIEWNLADGNASSFFAELQQRGIRVNETALKFFELSYAAFRFGQCSLCAEISQHDEGERKRLLRAAGFYQQRIADLFKCTRLTQAHARQNRRAPAYSPTPG
jgi:hypothetical protein